MFNNKEKNETTVYSENRQYDLDKNLETLKKLKLLLDEGIITQEEYDTKKKELLKL